MLFPSIPQAQTAPGGISLSPVLLSRLTCPLALVSQFCQQVGVTGGRRLPRLGPTPMCSSWSGGSGLRGPLSSWMSSRAETPAGVPCPVDCHLRVCFWGPDPGTSGMPPGLSITDPGLDSAWSLGVSGTDPREDVCIRRPGEDGRPLMGSTSQRHVVGVDGVRGECPVLVARTAAVCTRPGFVRKPLSPTAFLGSWRLYHHPSQRQY